MQGKRAANNTTRGLSLQWQKMKEPARAGVCRHQCRRASVTVAPGEVGAGTHCCQSQGAIDDDNKDTASKNNGNYDVVFFATVAVGVYDVVSSCNGGGDSCGGSWLQLVVDRRVP